MVNKVVYYIYHPMCKYGSLLQEGKSYRGGRNLFQSLRPQHLRSVPWNFKSSGVVVDSTTLRCTILTVRRNEILCRDPVHVITVLLSVYISIMQRIRRFRRICGM